MKQHGKGFLAGVIATVLVISLAIPAIAATVRKTIEVEYGIQLQIDGAKAEFKDVNGNVVKPFVYNGTTYVPIRGAAESLFASVGYDSATNQATITSVVPDLKMNAISMNFYHELYVICINADNVCDEMELAGSFASRGEKDRVVSVLKRAIEKQNACIAHLNSVIDRINALASDKRYSNALASAVVACESLKNVLSAIDSASMTLAKYTNGEGESYGLQLLSELDNIRRTISEIKYTCDESFDLLYKNNFE